MDLLQNGYKAKLRPSGHDISEKFSKDNAGAIRPNWFQIANTDSNSFYLRKCKEARIPPHPARLPPQFPEYFIKFLTDESDIVLDPFAGSNVTGYVAERLRRNWVSIERVEEYVKGSRFRFQEPKKSHSKEKKSLMRLLLVLVLINLLKNSTNRSLRDVQLSEFIFHCFSCDGR